MNNNIYSILYERLVNLCTPIVYRYTNIFTRKLRQNKYVIQFLKKKK